MKEPSSVGDESDGGVATGMRQLQALRVWAGRSCEQKTIIKGLGLSFYERGGFSFFFSSSSLVSGRVVALSSSPLNSMLQPTRSAPVRNDSKQPHCTLLHERRTLKFHKLSLATAGGRARRRWSQVCKRAAGVCGQGALDTVRFPQLEFDSC